MSLDMTHDDVQAALAAEALDALDGPERAAVLAHLKSCDECRRELASLREAAASLAYAAPPAPMDAARSSRLRSRLLARAHADRGVDGVASQADAALLRAPAGDDVTMLRPTPADDVTALRSADTGGDTTLLRPMSAAPDRAGEPEPGVVPIDRARSARRGFGGGWLAAAASVLLLLAAGVWALSLRGENRDLLARNAELNRRSEELAVDSAEYARLVDALSAPEVRVIELASTSPTSPSGRMFWDPERGYWTFFAHHFPALRPGRDYQLWVITPEGPQAADVFKVDSAGHAVVRMKKDVPPEQVQAIAVTEEPEGGLPKPTGTPFLVGTTTLD